MKRLFLVIALFALPMLACTITAEIEQYLENLQIDVATTIQENGAGELTITASSDVKDEDGESIIDCSSVNRDALPAGARLIEVQVDGLPGCRIQTPFSDLAALQKLLVETDSTSSGLPALGADVNCLLIKNGVLYYDVLIAAKADSQADTNKSEQSPSTSYVVPYSVNVPGPIQSHNAPSRRGSTLTWDMLKADDGFRINLEADEPCPEPDSEPHTESVVSTFADTPTPATEAVTTTLSITPSPLPFSEAVTTTTSLTATPHPRDETVTTTKPPTATPTPTPTQPGESVTTSRPRTPTPTATSNPPAGSKCIRGNVAIRFLAGLPLGNVVVNLNGYDEARNNTYWVGSAVTDLDGDYEICSRDLALFMNDLFFLEVVLLEADPDLPAEGRFGLAILDESTARPRDGGMEQTPFSIRMGDGGALGVSEPRYYFRIDTDVDPLADLSKDIWVYEVQDNPATSEREDHAFEAAILYYHTYQAIRFLRTELGYELPRGDAFRFNTNYVYVSEGGTPLWMHSAYCDACTDVSGIFYSAEGAVWNDGNAPRNREYHELAHWAMLQVFGDFPPRLYEANGIDFNNNGVYDQDTNHSEIIRGYRNVLSSSDAWTEGFAEFLALVIADYYDNHALEKFWQDLLPPYVYTVGHPIPYLINVEHNGRRETEEIAVAALLWDFYDPVNLAEDDGLEVPIQEIWALVTAPHLLPKYFEFTADNNGVLSFVGDEHTYPTDERARAAHTDSCAVWSDPPVPVARETRHIHYIKDLYDVFSNTPTLNKAYVTDTFKAHRFFVNSYRFPYVDVVSRQIVSIADGESTVSYLLSDESPVWSGWMASLDMHNRSWGAGIAIDRPVDARGFGYINVWVNAPVATNASILVEDNRGEWLAPVTIEGGDWELLTVPLVKRPSGGLPQGFQPNPFRNTPPAQAQMSRRTIKRVGLIVHDTGQSQVDVSTLWFTLDFPWKPGSCQIVGIGDPGLGPFQPYRRDMPPLPGASALIRVNEFPATLNVQVEYGAPYADLSFSYPVELKQETTAIGLYIEPALGEEQNRISLTASKEAYTDSQPVSLDSRTYWQQLGAGEHVLETELSLKPLESTVLPVVDVLKSFRAKQYASRSITFADGSNKEVERTIELGYIRTSGSHGGDEYAVFDNGYAIYQIGDAIAERRDGVWEASSRDGKEFVLGIGIYAGIPDSFDRSLGGVFELEKTTLNDIAVTRYVLESPSSLARMELPTVTDGEPQINWAELEVWVADEGNFIVKYLLAAEIENALDFNDDDEIVTVKEQLFWSWELYDINADFEIDWPAAAPTP